MGKSTRFIAEIALTRGNYEFTDHGFLSMSAVIRDEGLHGRPALS
jgi:hypothetical protein